VKLEDGIAFEITFDFICGVIGFASLAGAVAFAVVDNRLHGDALRHANSHLLGLPERGVSGGDGSLGDVGGDCGGDACD
jgi:hypothetical protein